REHFDSDRVSEDETSAAISGLLERTGEILCPHSAIAATIGDKQQAGATPMVSLATAHPAKFPDAVQAATDHRPGLPNTMADLYERTERVTRVGNDLEALKSWVKDRIAH
ncbi:MAG: threonine synthase, partial [Paracoccaceae bacterium]|nr:threonine synthase [Paracoccaceae bacterium]